MGMPRPKVNKIKYTNDINGDEQTDECVGNIIDDLQDKMYQCENVIKTDHNSKR